ncbi:MBL fold metallo-hydrolase [Bacillus lacus]|uniref:MBL fold metallo-hydrolase n=1 Tax=Metabacillus lacus TaxID=1983721 RepID=A0A7X2IY21_9BACI|nr:MBL fold metallo-hydrolase [Metabacillus lacus]MRX71913.1 MBL fold metallo-hydrolase [Metabacillus lacus]
MELLHIKGDCFYFKGAVNIGYVRDEENGLLIDAGLDQQSMKKVLKLLKEKQLPVTHLFITHAHTDHFGGAGYLQSQKHVHTIAPPIEEAILRNPILEPLYLFQGNKPISELRNKFLEGETMRVDEEAGALIQFGSHSCKTFTFPGHSINQMGVLVSDILYCGDAYFGREQLAKHRIPFIISAEDTLASLTYLKQIECYGAVPGHGNFQCSFIETVEENERCHQEILSWVEQLFAKRGTLSFEDYLVQLLEEWQVDCKHLSSWLLYRTAAMAYITLLVHTGSLVIVIEANRLLIKAVSEQ